MSRRTLRNKNKLKKPNRGMLIFRKISQIKSLLKKHPIVILTSMLGLAGWLLVYTPTALKNWGGLQRVVFN